MNTLFYPLNQLSAIALKGDNTQQFLQGQLTCDMNQLTKSGDFSFAACCDHKGRMVANFWVLRRTDDFLFILPTTMRDIVIAHLQKYALFSKVTLAPYNQLWMYATTTTRINTTHFTISLPNPDRKLIVCTEQCHENNSDNNDATWMTENIKDHLALLSPNTSLLFTPQMISLEKQGGVSFTKGCYIGQEIIARTQYLGKLKRHLHRIHIKSDQPLQPGDFLLNDGNEKAGVIVNSVFNGSDVDALAVIEDHALETVQHCLMTDNQ